MKEIEVIDLRPGSSATAQIVSGSTPSDAAARLLGEPVVRSGAPKNLIAKCYFVNETGGRNMVRFYRTVETAALLAVTEHA